MIQDIVVTMIRAAAWQLIMHPPFDRVFSTHFIGRAYFVASGDRTYMRGTTFEGAS